MTKTFIIIIQGQVQGVGFRPFVFALAEKFKLKGEVLNNEEGVIILLNASEEKATEFLTEILANPPKTAIISGHSFDTTSEATFKNFRICASKKKSQINIPLTPDFTVCKNCKLELISPSNRRYNYAFTTCVSCGPRYAITNKYPFERKNTSLSKFEMCRNCAAEYKDPTNIRFHSQTNSCNQCGIKMSLVSSVGKVISNEQSEIINLSVDFLSNGQIVALKSINGYMLCCDASNELAITRLREKKKRANKPFALLYPSIEKVDAHFLLRKEEREALVSAEAPIVIIPFLKPIDALQTAMIAPNLEQLGVMLPSSALLFLLMYKFGKPIVATSGNIHGSPIIADNFIAEKTLANIADYLVHHNLEISFPQDDSVVKFSDSHRIVVRRSRGMAPNYLKNIVNLNASTTRHNKSSGLAPSATPILAMGAHLKSTFAFVPNSNTYVSQYFGNLDSFEVSKRFTEVIKSYVKLFESTPKIVLTDNHPQYQSTEIGKDLASDWKAGIVGIQHHKAHFSSVLAEHNLFASEEKILGVIWDGTGYGDDNAIWGGEFFVYQNRKIIRSAHFEYFDWIAANKFAEEPRLSLLSVTSEENRQFLKHKFSDLEWSLYNKILESNTLKTSSVGRLFDAVASALDITDYNTYEGEAAMRLENLAIKYTGSEMIDFLQDEEYSNIPSGKLLENILNETLKGTSCELIAASFIHTLAKSIIKVSKEKAIDIIACSGGVFQNTYLIDQLNSLIRNTQFKLKFNRNLSSNDENISFGQLQYYLNVKP